MIPRRIYEHVRAHNWFAVAIDFLIVVLGILIAFQITSWNEARQDRSRERQYLARIAAELDRSISVIEHAIRRTKERSAFGELLMRSADDPRLVRADPGRFLKAIVSAGYTLSPDVRSQTFEEIKSAGDLGILRDEKLRFDLMEFHTVIQGTAQWDYIRELRQTEYIKRSAGILTYEQLVRVADAGENLPAADEDEAMGAHARMVARPAFIEWLPTMSDRVDDAATYAEWLDAARDLRARIDATPGVRPAGRAEPAP